MVKNWFEEPHSKLEEDTHLAIALSTSIEDRRKSLADFSSYVVPAVTEPKEEVTEISLIDAAFNPFLHSSKNAFLFEMSQKAKESSLSTIRGKKNEVAKGPFALLALDQNEVKRRLAEKATALVLEQPDNSAFYDADMSCFPKSKLTAKYCREESKDFLWHLSTQNTEKLFNYYVKELAHPIVFTDAGCSSHQQRHSHWQMSDERPEASLLDPTVTSLLCGSTQTALVLAELAAQASTEMFFADEISQKSICSYQEMLKNSSPDAAAAKGFCLFTDEVCEKASSDLLNAWSQMVDNDCLSDMTVNCRDGEVICLHRLVIMVRYPNLLQIIESESSTKIFSQFSKRATLSVVRFIYFADTDVCHTVVFEAKRLAESLRLTDFCKVCENLIKIYNLIEASSPETSATTLEELVTCSWSVGLNVMQRGKGNSCEKILEKNEVEDAVLDDVCAFVLTQRRNQMNKGGISEDWDHDGDTSTRSLEDKDESLMLTGSFSFSGSDNKGQSVLLLELNMNADSCDETLSKAISLGKSHKVVMGHVSGDSALTSAEHISLSAKTFPSKILSEKKEFSSVHVELSGGKAKEYSDSYPTDSNMAIDSVIIEDEAGRCLSENDVDDYDNDEEDDDEKVILVDKSGDKFALGYATDTKLYHDKNDSREISCLLGGSCVSFDIPRSDPVVEIQVDSDDVCAVDGFGGKEPVAPCALILPMKLSSCSSVQGFDPSAGSANGSPDLFPSSPCSGSLVSSVVCVQKPSVLLQAAKKLKNVLGKDKVFREVSEESESMFDFRINLFAGGSREDIEGQSDAECDKLEYDASALKKTDSFICLEKSILETHCHSQVHAHCYSQDNLCDAEHHLHMQTTEKLTDDNLLPDLDSDNNCEVESSAKTTCGQSLTAAFLNCCENYIKSNNLPSNDNEVEDSMCGNEVLFPHGMGILNLSQDVEIITKSSRINESFLNHLVSSSKSLLSCRLNLPVVTDEVDNDCQMSDDKTSDEVQNVEICDEKYCETKCRHCSDFADSAANDKDDDGYEDKSATQSIFIKCDDEAAVLHTNGRICDVENIWENFPEEEFLPHVSFENERNVSHVQLSSMTPKSMKMRGQSTPGKINYSPPTDLETDVSALMEDVITNSNLFNSDTSFDASIGPARAMIVAKSPPVTPLPRYGQMNTPALQQCCYDYGIRRLPKKQMVGVLESIYFELHPGIPKPKTIKVKQNAIKKTQAVTKKRNLATFLTVEASDPAEQDNLNILVTGHSTSVTSNEICQERSCVAMQMTPEVLKQNESESDDYLQSECPKLDFVNDEDKEEIGLKFGKKTKTDSQLRHDYSLKKEILLNFFSKSADLYQRILNYEPLELDYLKKLLKEKEIQVASHFLIDFLDQQNILFTTRNNRSVRNRQLLANGKVISRPPPQNSILSIE